MADEMLIAVTEEEYEKATSKFPAAGMHIVELDMPSKKSTVSYAFPFTIREDTPDDGKPGTLFGGTEVKKADGTSGGFFKTRQIIDAARIKPVFVKIPMGQMLSMSETGKLLVGKKIKVLYVDAVDSRSREEGGKGSHYTKPAEGQAAFPLETDESDIGIG